MFKSLYKETEGFRLVSILTPLCMIGEVVMEMIIPKLMSSIIDDGVTAGNLSHIYRIGGWMIVAAAFGLLFGVLDRCKTMSHYNKRFSFYKLADSTLNEIFILWVSIGCSFIKNNHSCIFKNRSCNSNSLTLSARKFFSSVSGICIISVFQIYDKVMTAGSFRSSYHLIVCRIWLSETNVFTDTFIKQKIVLSHITDLTHQLGKRNLFDIFSTENDLSLCSIPKTSHEFCNR